MSGSTDGETFDRALMLIPAFRPEQRQYTVTVPRTVTHVQLTPTFGAARAVVTKGAD